MITDGFYRVHTLVHIAAIRGKSAKDAAEATLREALPIADTLDERRVPGRNEALGIIAAAQAKAGDVEGALRTAASVENVKDETLRQTAGDAKALVLLDIAAAQAEVGDVKGALKTAEGIKHSFEIPSFKVSALARIAIAQAKAGDRAGAEHTFRQALETINAFRQRIRTPDEKFLLGGFVRISLQEIAVARARAGDFKGALETAAAIEDEVTKADALREIAKLQAKAGDQAAARSTCVQALGVMSKIEAHSLKVEALVEIAKAQAEIGDRPASAKTLEQALQAASATYNFGPEAHNTANARSESPQHRQRRDALTEIAVVQARAGDIKSALKTAGTIKGNSSDFQGSALQKIAEAQAEAGDVRGALEWANTQTSPAAKSRALLGVAEGILLRKEQKNAPSPAPKR
jgi:tetratricopeptide (TPR) repeat protein